MATWKSKKVKTMIDFMIDYSPADVWWEYQTASDSFSFLRKGMTPSYPWPPKEFLHCDSFDKSEAILLLQALANWIEKYEGKDALEECLLNNPFKE